MELFFGWLFFAGIVGLIAASFNRSGFGYFVLSALLSPLLGIIVLLIAGKRQDTQAPNPSTHVKCPECRELVLKDARKCKHCGCALVPQ